MSTRRIGKYYEDLACEFLVNQGLQIVTKNYHVANVGEIDIIACHDKILPAGRVSHTLVFVEVRARKHSRFASSVETITRAKQRRIIATASHYLQTHALECNCRFDVIAFDVASEGGIVTTWLMGAFLADDV